MPKNINAATLQLTGIFARLVAKKMTVEEAMQRSIEVTDTIEKSVTNIVEENKKLRQMNKGLHLQKYKMNERIAQLEQKVMKAEKEYSTLYANITDDSFEEANTDNEVKANAITDDSFEEANTDKEVKSNVSDEKE